MNDTSPLSIEPVLAWAPSTRGANKRLLVIQVPPGLKELDDSLYLRLLLARVKWMIKREEDPADPQRLRELEDGIYQAFNQSGLADHMNWDEEANADPVAALISRNPPLWERLTLEGLYLPVEERGLRKRDPEALRLLKETSLWEWLDSLPS